MSAATTTMNGSSEIIKPSLGPNIASKQQSQPPSLKSGKSHETVGKQAVAGQGDGKERKQQPQQPTQAKAWRGPNPITSSQRSSPALPNGTEKPLPKLPPHAQQAKFSAELSADKHAHDRLLYLLAHLVGQDAILTLKNGEQFSGIFTGGSFDSPTKNQYVLKMAKRTNLSSNQQVNGATDGSSTHEYVGEGDDHVMTFDVQDTADLAVSNVSNVNGQPTQNDSATSTPFRTDADISSRRDPQLLRQRELQRWEPAGTDTNIDMSLDSSTTAGWDQFATNERMYGVQSTYDETYYTTAINRDDPRYREREAKAAKIARDIEASSTAGNAHVAEERTRDAERRDGRGEDEGEEDKYSGVKRESNAQLPRRGAGSYVPPSQRPVTGAPTVQGAPYDPAIISSQLARPPAEKAQDSLPAAAESTAQAEPIIDGAISDVGTAVPTVKKQPTEQSTEDHVRGTADAFKQFANSEKLRLRAAQEAKRANMKNEKNVRLNDLKKFAANFKLKSRVPDDLVPILAKDREKQMDIQQKAEEAAKEEEHVRAVEKEKEKTAPPSTAPSTTAQGAASSAATTSEQRMASFNQQHRTSRLSQQVRGGPAPMLGPSPRGPGRTQLQMPYRQGLSVIEPLPPNLRIPSGPAMPAFAATDKQAPLSPASALRLNVNAFEFRPAANTFTPSATSPSPQSRLGSDSVDGAISKDEAFSGTFYGKQNPKKSVRSLEEFEDSYHPIKLMKKSTKYTDEQRKVMEPNGGIPKPYRTPPTWDTKEVNLNTPYLYSFPTTTTSASTTMPMTMAARQLSSQGPSPLHTPNSATLPGLIPQALHPIPHHPQQQQQMQMQMQAGPGQHGMPQPRPPFYAMPSHSHNGVQPHQHHYHPSMPSGPPPFGNSSVQSSPRFGPAQMAAFAPPQPPFGLGNHQAVMSMQAMNGMGPMGMAMNMQPAPPSSPYAMAQGLHLPHPHHQQQQQQHPHHQQAHVNNNYRPDSYRPDLYRPEFRPLRPGGYASAPPLTPGQQAHQQTQFPPGAAGGAAGAQQMMLLQQQQQHAAHQQGYNQMPGMHGPPQYLQMHAQMQQGQQQAGGGPSYSPMSMHASPHVGVLAPMNSLQQQHGASNFGGGRSNSGSGANGQMMALSASQQGYLPNQQQLQHQQQQGGGFPSPGLQGYQGQHPLQLQQGAQQLAMHQRQHQQQGQGGHMQHSGVGGGAGGGPGGYHMQARQLSAGAGPRSQSSQPFSHQQQQGMLPPSRLQQQQQAQVTTAPPPLQPVLQGQKQQSQQLQPSPSPPAPSGPAQIDEEEAR